MSVNEFKSYFFDRADWKQILEPATKSALSRVGAILMVAARGMIRKRKKESRPGGPPTSWKGLLKKFIYFAYDPYENSVIVGPAYLSGPHKKVYPIDRPTIPAILEFGGKERVKDAEVTFRGVALPANRVARIAARPYMAPALEKKRAKILEAFRGFLGRDPRAMFIAGRLRSAKTRKSA